MPPVAAAAFDRLLLGCPSDEQHSKRQSEVVVVEVGEMGHPLHGSARLSVAVSWARNTPVFLQSIVPT